MLSRKKCLEEEQEEDSVETGARQSAGHHSTSLDQREESPAERGRRDAAGNLFNINQQHLCHTSPGVI